eukprot:3588154-Amphidinium_carterae.1
MAWREFPNLSSWQHWSACARRASKRTFDCLRALEAGQEWTTRSGLWQNKGGKGGKGKGKGDQKGKLQATETRKRQRQVRSGAPPAAPGGSRAIR